MSKLVTFIKKELEEDSMTPSRFTIDELVSLRTKLGTTPFFQVPESHAEQVLRKNPRYQEVDYDRISALAAKPRRTRRKSVTNET